MQENFYFTEWIVQRICVFMLIVNLNYVVLIVFSLYSVPRAWKHFLYFTLKTLNLEVTHLAKLTEASY